MSDHKILLIDDDEDDFILIRDLLSNAENVHFIIDWVPHFEEAIRLLNNGDHDICLLDYRLTGHNGLEILTQIDTSTNPMPIIFLTGRGDYQVDIMAMKAGAEDYLSKDEISASLLERTIRYAIDRKKSRTALQKAYTEMEQAVLHRTAELVEANERLKKSSKTIKQFAFSVSHDIKNPAVGIYGLTRRLLNNYSDILDDKGQRICMQILHASEQIASLVENINIYINTNEMPLRYEVISLKEVCGIIQEEFSTPFAIRGIEWSEPDRDLFIKADRMSIIRALRNLIDNSLKYGGDTLTRISILFRDSGKYNIVSVNDNGVGLTETDTEKLFGLFYRGKNSKTIDGNGLGLAIVKEIAEQHGGDVCAESCHNQGMTISMSFSKSL